MLLSPAEIAAYLGAGAWVPQIFNWLFNFATRSLITITPDKYVSIGYTTLGPIFNLRLSVNVERKDTLLDFMCVELCHEDGDKRVFEWAGMQEYFSEVKK